MNAQVTSFECPTQYRSPITINVRSFYMLESSKLYHVLKRKPIMARLKVCIHYNIMQFESTMLCFLFHV